MCYQVTRDIIPVLLRGYFFISWSEIYKRIKWYGHILRMHEDGTQKNMWETPTVKWALPNQRSPWQLQRQLVCMSRTGKWLKMRTSGTLASAGHSTTLQCMRLTDHVTLNFNSKMSTAAMWCGHALCGVHILKGHYCVQFQLQCNG
jgi:hypothetical protein